MITDDQLGDASSVLDSSGLDSVAFDADALGSSALDSTMFDGHMNIDDASIENVGELDIDVAGLGEDKPVSRFSFAKPLDVPQQLDNLPPIIKAKEIDGVVHIVDFARKAKVSIENYRLQQESELQSRYEDMLAKVRLDTTKKFVSDVEIFLSNQEKYFDMLEQHCMVIVRQSLAHLLGDIEDDTKLIASINLAATDLKEQSTVVLKVNPEQLSIASPLAESQNWQIDVDANIACGDCQFDVSLGSYISHFKTTVDLLIDTIDI